MDAIFKALNDTTRRALLDSLRETDGQTLSELEAALSLSRFGVMKHLRVLEEAQLITTRKSGRFKYHYLNPLPLQEVMDRWIRPFLSQQVRDLSALKQQLETQAMKPDLVLSTYIACSHDALWDALTKGDLIAQYHFACNGVEGDYSTPGDEVVYHRDSAGPMLSNRVISITPKTRIEMDFRPSWDEDRTASRCVYLVEPQASGMKLTVEHFELPATQPGIEEGWMRFLAGLKTWLETGRSHRFAMEAAQ